MSREITDECVRSLLGLDASGKISRRRYRQLRDAVDRLASRFQYQGTAEHAIFNIVRQRFGCRATEIRECDLDDALELVADLEKHVRTYVKVNADFQVNAIKQVFGGAGVAALEEGAQEALSELCDPYELPDPPPINYSGNVVRFPGNE